MGALRLRPVTLRVHRVGFEPTSCPGKNRVQSSFATDASRAGASPARAGGGNRQLRGPTLWNRTRTSRASTERADQLRKSGIRAPRAWSTSRSLEMPPRSARRRSSSSFFGCQRAGARGAPRASMRALSRRAHLGRERARMVCGRTSGVSALSVQKSAPISIRDLDFRSRVEDSDCRDSDDGPETSKGRLVSLGGPSIRDV